MRSKDYKILSKATILVFSLTALSATAAPVKFAFNATIGPPNTVSPFDVPFDLRADFEEGDVIRGTVTVEPVDVSSDIKSTNTVTMQQISLDINGVVLATDQYSTSVNDDLTLADLPVVPFDEIRLSCSPFVGAFAVCDPVMHHRQ